MGAARIRRNWGRRAAAAAVAGALLAGAVPAPALAAPGGGGGAGGGAGGPFPWSMATELTSPSANPEVAQRQALGCTLVGLGVTGVAVASGALASAGSGGPGAVAVGAMVGEIVTYFGAGCSIGAFLAGLFSMGRPAATTAAADVGG
ncbi:MAG TPA: hypothetical protein VD860_04325 [Azospirillum sp.]|nr:hypothetical protein [Azospirillum sp.]